MMEPNDTSPGDALDDLFVRYRAACPDVEASAAFMPGLWQRIDARRSFVWRLRHYARGLVTVAAAVCLAVGILGSMMAPQVNPVYMQTYVEALDADESAETLAYADVIRAADYRSGEAY
jgi:hypothetical protein